MGIGEVVAEGSFVGWQGLLFFDETYLDAAVFASSLGSFVVSDVFAVGVAYGGDFILVASYFYEESFGCQGARFGEELVSDFVARVVGVAANLNFSSGFLDECGDAL